MAEWRFTKMHGLGNDFVVLDAIRQQVEMTAALARRIADRAFGIGCDQILLVEPPPDPTVDFGYRIFNADGSEVAQCGNGARCFARYVRDEGLTAANAIRVRTKSGVIVLHCTPDEQVTVDMGVPRWRPAEVPFLPEVADPEAAADVAAQLAADLPPAIYPLRVGEERVWVSVVSMGNPHAVLVVGNAAAAPVAMLGPAIERHPAFPDRVNVGFMEVVSPHAIRLRVFERGAGETLACGTGACAAVVAGIWRGLLASPVTVTTRGGTLTIAWAGEGTPVAMTGPAVTVFRGTFDPEALAERPRWPDLAG